MFQIQPVDVSTLPAFVGWVIGALAFVLGTVSGLYNKLLLDRAKRAEIQTETLDARLQTIQKERLEEALEQQALLVDVQAAMAKLDGREGCQDVLQVLTRIESKIDGIRPHVRD